MERSWSAEPGRVGDNAGWGESDRAGRPAGAGGAPLRRKCDHFRYGKASSAMGNGLAGCRLFCRWFLTFLSGTP